MNDEYDIHPLDRDYSLPIPPRKKPRLNEGQKLRRAGVVVFGGGFVTTFIAAVMITNFERTWLESAGSTMHQLGMIGILIGGLIIVASYRLDETHNPRRDPRRPGHRPNRHPATRSRYPSAGSRRPPTGQRSTTHPSSPQPPFSGDPFQDPDFAFEELNQASQESRQTHQPEKSDPDRR